MGSATVPGIQGAGSSSHTVSLSAHLPDGRLSHVQRTLHPSTGYAMASLPLPLQYHPLLSTTIPSKNVL